jgi:hypothetical protein
MAAFGLDQENKPKRRRSARRPRKDRDESEERPPVVEKPPAPDTERDEIPLVLLQHPLEKDFPGVNLRPYLRTSRKVTVSCAHAQVAHLAMYLSQIFALDPQLFRFSLDSDTLEHQLHPDVSLQYLSEEMWKR